MFKKFPLLFVIFFMAFIASGCIRYSTRMELTPQDELIVIQQFGFDMDFLEMIDSYFDKESFLEYLESKTVQDYTKRFERRGYSTGKYVNDKYAGKQFNRMYNRAKYVEQMDLPEGYTVPSGIHYPIKITRNAFRTTHSIRMQFNPKELQEKNKNIITEIKKYKREHYDMEEEPDDELRTLSSLEELFKQDVTYPKMDLTIKIPQKATTHNAAKENDLTHEYTWVFSDMNEVKEGKPVDIVLEYQKDNVAGMISIIILIIIAMIIIIANRKYIRESDDTKNAF